MKVWHRTRIELKTPGSAVRLTSVARHLTDCATRPGEEFVVMIKMQSTMIPAYLYTIENQVSNVGLFWVSFFFIVRLMLTLTFQFFGEVGRKQGSH